MESMTARETAQAFLHYVFRFAGLPDSLVSDQGRAFIDAFWKAFCKTLGITHRLSTSYHPETDGQTERANRTLEVYLRHFVNYKQDDWVQWLPLAEFTMNSNDNASTGISPFFAAFGHHPRLDFRPELDAPTANSRPAFADTMASIHCQCRDAIGLAQAYQETYANRKRLPAPRYQVGDKVFLSLKNIKTTRPSNKLDHLRAGPWTITTMKTPLVAKLDLPLSLSRIDNNFHVSLLRPAFDGFAEQRQRLPPAVEPATADTLASYEVEEILDTRVRRDTREYLVRWSGYAHPTWEKEANLDNCDELLREFNQAAARRSSP